MDDLIRWNIVIWSIGMALLHLFTGVVRAVALIRGERAAEKGERPWLTLIGEIGMALMLLQIAYYVRH